MNKVEKAYRATEKILTLIKLSFCIQFILKLEESFILTSGFLLVTYQQINKLKLLASNLFTAYGIAEIDYNGVEAMPLETIAISNFQLIIHTLAIACTTHLIIFLNHTLSMYR